jgi:hypothetical protein
MRGSWVALCVIVALISPHSTVAEAPVDRPYDRRSADEGVVDMLTQAADYRVHEWGVWQLDANGRVRSLEDVARESPAFVHRQSGVPRPTESLPEFDPGGQYEVYDKPVVFFHTTEPLDITFTVRMPGGRPWLYYPDAALGRVQRDQALRFEGRLLGNTPLPAGLAYPEPPSGHWWQWLRAAGASPFISNSGRELERFIFYDGQGPFARGFTRRRRALVPIAGRVEPLAWRIDGRDAKRLAISGTTVTETALRGRGQVLTELRAALLARGLYAPEADALLNTWRPELFTAGGERVIWLLPRAAYDAMLPVEITPTPRELVRVGVVIEQL